jgi:Transposase DDE domain
VGADAEWEARTASGRALSSIQLIPHSLLVLAQTGEGKRKLRFVVSTFPYSGVYLVLLGRKHWAIEGFFKTIKHRFRLHCFGQSSLLGIYRWLILSLIAYLLAHWIDQWSLPSVLDWKAASDLARSILFPSILWFQLLKLIETRTDIAAHYGFEIILKPIPQHAYRDGARSELT